MNHEKYEQRMEFIRSLLADNNLEAKKIETIEYDLDSPFPYNNFIYLITLTSPTKSTHIVLSSQKSRASQYGTSPLPEGSNSLILRLSNDNPGTDLNNTNRVENEVAFMSIMRKALSSTKYNNIIPNVYAWASVSREQGFLMQQHMPGTMPDKVWKDLRLADKIVVRSQLAEILSLVQKFEVPETVRSYGGLTFDEEGNVISAQMTILKGGPFESYVDLVKFMFESQLKEADRSSVIDGWKPNGVRGRIEKFVENGLGNVFAGVDTRKVAVHSDFTTNNFLFDAETLQITAILDFDFSCIAAAVHEYAGYSFTDIPGGRRPGPFDLVQLPLRNAVFAGFPTDIPAPTEDDALSEWEEAKAWYTDLARTGALSPQNVKTFDKISNAFWLNDSLCPFPLSNEFLIKRRPAEKSAELRQENERLIVRFLEMEGY